MFYRVSALYQENLHSGSREYLRRDQPPDVGVYDSFGEDAFRVRIDPAGIESGVIVEFQAS